jgi:cytochrome P450
MKREDYTASTVKPDRYVPPLQILLSVARILLPIPSFFGWAAVTLRDDVEEVLSRPDVFQFPFAEETARLNDGLSPGTPFLPGIDDVAAHDSQLKLVMEAFRRSDADWVGEIATRCASAIVADAHGRLEAISQLIARVPIDICVEYLGVAISDRATFTRAVLVLSGHLFSPPPIVKKKNVDANAVIVREVVDQAIRAEGEHPSGADTVIARLVRSEGADPRVRAILIGLIVGFIQNNTLAGGHILDMLLRRRGFLEASRAAARQGDDILLSRCLFEALRFKPINYGPFRLCATDYIVAEGTPRAKRIRAGTKVLACTMSAMFDRHKVHDPFVFMPGRPASDFMHFGFGMHWCVGAIVARAQIVQTFKPLLLLQELQRADGPDGKLKLWPQSVFPQSLTVKLK